MPPFDENDNLFKSDTLKATLVPTSVRWTSEPMTASGLPKAAQALRDFVQETHPAALAIESDPDLSDAAKRRKVEELCAAKLAKLDKFEPLQSALAWETRREARMNERELEQIPMPDESMRPMLGELRAFASRQKEPLQYLLSNIDNKILMHAAIQASQMPELLGLSRAEMRVLLSKVFSEHHAERSERAKAIEQMHAGIATAREMIAKRGRVKPAPFYIDAATAAARAKKAAAAA